MFRIFVIVGALCTLAWYYFFAGAQLDEAMVRNHYADEAHATLSRNPDGLCKLFASKLVLTQETVLMGQSSTETMNQKQACDSQKNRFRHLKNLVTGSMAS